MSTLKRQVNSSSNFASFFIVMTNGSSVNFKLIHFLLWIKGSHQSPNFETFKCSGEHLPYSSCHIPNHKSIFLQILHPSSVPSKITPLYFFRSNFKYFAQKEPIKNFCEFWVLRSKFSNFLSFLNHISFSSSFASLFSVMKHKSFMLFLPKFYVLSTKYIKLWAYQGMKFHMSSWKSAILHSDGFLFPKSYKVSNKNVQKSYLSWHLRVMQSLKKNWLVVSNMT